MPRRDGSGPNAMGPLSGRGLGLCETGRNVDTRRGMFNRMGCGRGFGRGYCAVNALPLDSKIQKQNLETEKEILMRQLEIIENNLKGMDE